MSKITSVEPQKKNPHRFNIFLDGEFAFGADEDLIVEHRLVVGKIIDPPLLEKLLFEAEVGKLMERVYMFFSIRQRSEKEVKDYFRIKNQQLRIKSKEQISDLAINLLIEKLKQKGLLNDEEFARAWTQARRRSKQKGNIAIKSELFQKGISKEIIDKILAESVDEEFLAEQALEKKIKSWKDLPKIEFKKKAYQFLAGKGFDFNTISSVVEKLFR